MNTRLIFVLALLWHVLAAPPSGRAQVYEEVSSFTDARAADLVNSPNKGSYPYAAVVQGSDGSFYGTTEYGGSSNNGTVFKMTPSGVLTTLVEFTGNGASNKGFYPRAGVVQGSDGNFYGTTQGGGAFGVGTVFKMTPSGVLTTLVEFTGAGASNKGSYPYAGVVQGSDGSFYGTTSRGGASDFGTVFKMTQNGVLTTLVEFTDNGASNKGTSPFAGVVQGSDGSFYGTTAGGLATSKGTVFKMTPSGVLTTLVEFTGFEGSYPSGGVVQGSDGSFYGTTKSGGALDKGTVFKMTPSGVLTTLVEFTGAGASNKGTSPYAGLVQGSDGSFYGTTSRGGASDFGTVFKMTPNGALTTLVEFTDNGASNKGTSVYAGVVQGSDGNFYGTTEYGGALNKGTVFKMTPSGVLTTLVEFTNNGASSKGSYPSAGVVQGSDGSFYGTTYYGGASDFGTVFKMTRSGALTTLVEFIDNGASNKGSYPSGGVVQGSDGSFYGTTRYGGAIGGGTVFSQGTVFKMTPSGVLTTLVEFSGNGASNKGSNPSPGVVQGSDGSFYGTTQGGGASNNGTVFTMTSSGALTTLVEFTGNGASNKGARPTAGVVQGSDGSFYGTTLSGGAFSKGTVFKMTPSGALTTLVEFTGTGASNKGTSPYAGVVQGSDGSFYGTTQFGGASNSGTVFKMTPSGVLTTLVEFTGNGASNKGSKPYAGVVQGSDGSFYGTTEYGGASNNGTVFKMTPSGILTTLVEFTDDGAPRGALTRGTDENLYGTTSGPSGTIFRLVFTGAPLLSIENPSLGSGSAVVQAKVNPRGASTAVTLESGTDGTTFPNTQTVAVSLSGYQSKLVGGTLEGLNQGAIYYYRFSAVNSMGTTVGPVQSFATLADPAVSVSPASAITRTSGQFNGTVNARNYDTTVSFEWGTDGNTFPNTVTAVPSTVTGNTAVAVNAGPGQTLVSGQTYYYRIVATNAAGSVTSGTQSFITLTDPVVTVGSATVLNSGSAAVSGTVDAKGTNTAAVFEYATNAGFTGSVSTPTVPSPVVGVGATGVTATLAGLTPGTTYFYRVVATSAGGGGTSTSSSFTTPSLPALTATTASAIGIAGATLNGTANANGLSTTVAFDYGTDGVSFPNSVTASPATVTGSSATAVSATVGGLAAGTIYRFRVRGTSTAGSAASPSVVPFTTLVVPTATTGAASSVTATSAAVSGSINANGTSTSVAFEYGTDGVDFPFSVAATPSPVAGGMDTAVNAVLGGLAQNTTYYFRVRGISAAGTATGSVGTFKTLQLPLVTNGLATGVSVSGATLSGTVNARGSDTTVSVEVSSDLAFTAPSSQAATPSTVTGNTATAISVSLGSLPASTTFFYRIRAVSAAGTVVGDVASFTTPSPPSASVTVATNVTGSSAQVNGTVNGLGTSATVSFEVATNAGFANPSTLLASPSVVSGTGDVSVNASVTGLQSGVTYHFRIKATSGGGSAISSEGTFTTLALPSVSGLASSNVGTQTATLNANVNANGQATTVVFEYGPTQTSLPFSVAATPGTVTGTGITPVSAGVSGLQPQTSYYFRVRATSVAGEALTSPLNFIMAGSARVITGVGTPTLGTSAVVATLSGTVNPFGLSSTVSFDYGTSETNLDQTASATPGNVSGTIDASVSAAISDLQQDVTYYFRVKASNSDGTTQGAVQQFKTPKKGGLVGVDDYIFYSGQVLIDPLRNDEDPDAVPVGDKSRLLIDRVLVQEPTVSQNRAVVSSTQKTISYTPQFNVKDVDTLIYRVGDGFGGEATPTVNLITFASRAGFYSGVIQDATNDPGRSGTLSLQMGSGGLITTSFVNWKPGTSATAESYRLKGAFSQFGELTATFTSSEDPNVKIILTLALGRTAKNITGTLVETNHDLETARVPTFTLTLNAGTGGLPESGLRTAFLSPPDQLATQMGDGYVVMTVALNRHSARFAGQLPDGEPFAVSAPGQGRSFSLTKGLERGGMLTGLVRMVGSESDQAGMLASLLWKKRAARSSERARFFAGAVETNLELQGMEYPVVAKNAAPPIELGAGNPNARLRLSGGELPAGLDFSLQIIGAAVSGFDSTALQLKLQPPLGTFSGRFKHPMTGEFIPFQGAFRVPLDTEPGQGRGVFRGPLSAGAVRIERQ